MRLSLKAGISLTCALLLLAAVNALAQETFYEAYASGQQLMREQRWSEAREAFLRAAALHPQPERRVKTYGLNFIRVYDPYANLAFAEAQLGMFEEARDHLVMSRNAGVTPKPFLEDVERVLRMKVAEKRKEKEQAQAPPAVQQPPASAAPQPAVWTLQSSPPGARVAIDGTDRGATPLSLTLPEGSHEAVFTLQGYQPVTQRIDLKSGEPQASQVTLQPLTAPATPAKEAPAQTAQPPLKQPVQQKTEAPAPAQSQPQPQPSQQGPAPQAAQPAAAPAPEKAQPSAQQPAAPQEGAAAGPKLRRTTLLAMILALVLACALLWLMTRRKSAVATMQPKAAPPQTTRISPTQPRLSKPEDTPTQALYDLDTQKRTATPTPVSVDFNELKKHSTPLKEGFSRDFGAYDLEAILGRGGMGTTYLARRKRDGLPVAIKVPHEHLLDNQEFAQRFLREGSLGSTLHHPNIIRIFEAEQLGAQPFIVMELIEGETLEKKLRRERTVPVHEALEIARDIALALDYARLKGVVHRDLKPDNIMMLRRGGLKVMDYGIARIVGSPGLTSSESYLGTPTYSAPEATSGQVDQQSDLYSLGIILYRMLSGDPPFRSADPIEVLQMHRSTPLPPFPKELSVPDEVSRLVATLTAKKKADRYPDAESFLIDLNKVLKHL